MSGFIFDLMEDIAILVVTTVYLISSVSQSIISLIVLILDYASVDPFNLGTHGIVSFCVLFENSRPSVMHCLLARYPR